MSIIFHDIFPLPPVFLHVIKCQLYNGSILFALVTAMRWEIKSLMSLKGTKKYEQWYTHNIGSLRDTWKYIKSLGLKMDNFKE